MNTKTKIKLLEIIEKDERLSILSRFYAWIAKCRLQRNQERDERINITFINWKNKNI